MTAQRFELPAPVRAAFCVSLALATLACGGTEPERLIQVGGTYSLSISLVGTHECGTVTIHGAGLISVVHPAGTTSFALHNQTTIWQGTLEPNGEFTTDVQTMGGSGVEPSEVQLTGQFSPSSFTATAAVDVDRPPAPTPCRFTTRWTGVKVSAQNVIP